MTNNQPNWRRVMAARIARLTPEQAAAKLDAIRAEGITINHPTVRELTGGFSSQSMIPQVVRRLWERSKGLRCVA